eukprot:2924643-Pleurochrysis_carterae.AAC.1
MREALGAGRFAKVGERRAWDELGRRRRARACARRRASLTVERVRERQRVIACARARERESVCACARARERVRASVCARACAASVCARA